MRERERDHNLIEGRVQRATQRLYSRLGPKVLLVCMGCGALIGVATAALIIAVVFRYLRLSSSAGLSVFELWVPILLGFVALGIWTVRGDVRKALTWSPGSGERSAVETWYVGVGIAGTVGRVALVASAGLPFTLAYVMIHYHRPWYDVFPLVIGGSIAVLDIWVLVVFASELVCAPMLRAIAAELPPGFEPRSHGMQLRTRALLPLPVVTFLAAMIVGGYADITRNPDARLVFSVGVCLATVAVATIIFLIVSRAVLAQVDDLTAGTHRVRRGDITTIVPVISSDELGRLASSFNGMLADLRRNTEDLRASRERIVAAADEERRRVERDLHDGAQQQLVLARLKLAQLSVDADQKGLVEELENDLDRALTELRDLAHGLYPQVLETDGLPGALKEAGRNAALPTTVDCDGAGRYRPELEAAVYFCCLEALQNAAKHAGDRAQASVTLAHRNGALQFEVADDGRGFDPTEPSLSTGLQNMSDRIGALGGELRIDSAPGCGTTVAGVIPLVREV